MRHRPLMAVILWLLLAAIALPASAGGHGGSWGGSVSVQGYFRSNGTYVAPHWRSAPDGNFWNNWSTKGNINPYTGVPGTRVTPPPNYRGAYAAPNDGGTYAAPTYTPAPSSAPVPALAPAGGPSTIRNQWCQEIAERLARLGHPVDWTRMTVEEMLDLERAIIRARAGGAAPRYSAPPSYIPGADSGDRNLWRQEIADRLSVLVIHVGWQRMTVEELLDLERVAKKHAP
jgi:hypothetical protein